jgi:hypothetical protein
MWFSAIALLVGSIIARPGSTLPVNRLEGDSQESVVMPYVRLDYCDLTVDKSYDATPVPTSLQPEPFYSNKEDAILIPLFPFPQTLDSVASAYPRNYVRRLLIWPITDRGLCESLIPYGELPPCHVKCWDSEAHKAMWVDDVRKLSIDDFCWKKRLWIGKWVMEQLQKCVHKQCEGCVDCAETSKKWLQKYCHRP